MAAFGVLGPLLAPHDPREFDVASRAQSPSSEHWLGTDFLGRDTFSRLALAYRIYVYLGLSAILLAALVVLVVVVFRRTILKVPAAEQLPEIGILALPVRRLAVFVWLAGAPFGIVFASLLPPSNLYFFWYLVVVSSVVPMSVVYQTVHATARSASGDRGDVSKYQAVSAPARTSTGPVKTVIRQGIEVVPVGFSLALLMAIFVESPLSFLGLGIGPPTATLGSMLWKAHNAPWMYVPAVGALAIAIGAFFGIANRLSPIGAAFETGS